MCPVSQAFRTELVRLAPKLRRFALSLCGNQADADDLVQAALERALRNPDAFREGTRLDSWMYRIVQNLFLDERRRGRVRGEAVDPEDANLSDAGRGAAEAVDRLTLDQVRAAMDRLPEAQRVTLALVAIEGLSYRKAAETMDVPLGTVMSRLARAREALVPLMASGGRRQ